MQNQSGQGAAAEEDQFGAKPPALSLPKGGGAIRGIGETFAANPVTGTGSMSVPIATSPGRSGFGPQLSLSYDSGAGNGAFGWGWSLSIPSITRKTDKGLPKYQDVSESDVFVLSGAEDLVPVGIATDDPSKTYLIQRYRPRIEGLFARIERWTHVLTHQAHWRAISKENITTLYGRNDESRIVDPANATRIFSWLICESYDDKGNAIAYTYAAEDSRKVDVAKACERNRTPKSRGTNRYLKRIKYGNTVSRLLPGFANTDWLFEVVFDYGEGHFQLQPPDAESRQTVRAHLNGVDAWPVRADAYSSYRSTFEVRTYRLCERVLVFHHFRRELGVDDYLVRSTEFAYHRGPIASFMTSVTQSGYVAWPDAANPTDLFLQRSMPAVEFEYSKAALSDEVREIDPESLANLPAGLDGSRYQWVDLDGEGLSGILTEQANAWFYKRNLGDGRFAPIERVDPLPAAAHLAGGGQQLLDLSGDGQLDLVEFSGATPGFYERKTDEDWDSFISFQSLPQIDWGDPNLRFVDLTGDGHADVLITEDSVLRWHPSLAEEGFGPEERSPQPVDEERGPRLVLADGTQSIYLADLSGDGLTDLVRIRNGEVSYWPNLGYGRFGARVTMDDSPWFDRPDSFDQRQIRLADIDGSGPADIIYLQRGQVTIYRNHSGNRWGGAETLTSFPPVDDLSTVLVADLLGAGTACLVWSSPLPGHSRRPMRYVDLMAKGKPHLLVAARNNLGAETHVHYAPSTRFYLQDRREGKPWITKLPFPVHVVERVETWDWTSRNRFVSSYAYHHGYFDGVEREFRGFGMVEQRDTEEFATLSASGEFPRGDNIDAASHVPPVLTKTWFHTGVYLGRDRVSNFFSGHIDADDRGEYYREPAWRDDDVEASKRLLSDTVLPAGLTVEEEREACRSLKGAMLRQEVYALDDSDKAQDPYTVTEQNFTIRCVQPRDGQHHAIFFTHAREAISYHYERDPSDPRVSHAFTLDADEYGNVLKALAIAYGRRQSPLPEPRDSKKQTTTLITYTENRLTNAIDDLVQHSDDYRTPLPAETRTYELTGFTPENNGSRFSFDEWTRNAFAVLLTAAEDIPYEQKPDPTATQKRLIEHVRTLYRNNVLTNLLPLGTVESRALHGESYKLAFTPGLAQQTYVESGKLTAVELNDLLPNEGRYVHSEGDANWWMPSGLMFFSPGSTDPPSQELLYAREHFFLPLRYRDPFHTNAVSTETFVAYDVHDLLVEETRDALDNRVTVGERNVDPTKPLIRRAQDYRVLQPAEVMDPNRNRTRVAFDVLGMVAGTAVMGKPLPAPVEGDSLDGFVPDLTQAQIDGLHDAADPHATAPALLHNATTRIVYDVDRFRRTRRATPQDPAKWLPPYAATLARETHASDPLPTQGLKLQISFSYSDGFGREIQKKIQAEPEKPGGAAGPPRFVGSGWTIFNNKGKPVRQYEPFFSQLPPAARHHFEFGVLVGVSPVLFYDPVERVVATTHPNDTYEKVVFDPWHQTTYDVNDTVAASGAQTGDPRTDPDIEGYLREYFKTQPASWNTWYAQRIGNPAGDPERDAAQKAAAHAGTPGVAHLDALGRAFLTIAHNRYERNGAIVEEKLATRVELDIEGNQREVVDAKDRVVMRYDYDMLGNRIHEASMEAGERWVVNDVSGKAVRGWDSRGFRRRFTYDELRRSAGLYVADGGTERLAERTTYGEGQGDVKNHRTRVYQVFDGAGIVTSAHYDFKGNLREGQRDLLPAYRVAVDWLQNPIANDGSFTSQTTCDALNRPLTITSPDGSVYRPSFNEANLLEKVNVDLRGAAATAFVTNIDYDAKGRRVRIVYGNGAVTGYEYDLLTFRLTNLKTTRPAALNGVASQIFTDATVVQDLRYAYDPVGNLTRITDAALKTVFHNGQQVDSANSYRYDAVYRLIEAMGREHIGQTAFDFNPSNGNCRDYPFLGNSANPSDLRALRKYTERYEYDAVGNFEVMRHLVGGNGWTRRYDYEEQSLIEAGKKNNRLTRTTVGNGFNHVEPYTHDAHGNMTAMPHLAAMVWDFEDQLQQAGLGGGGTAYYVYDAAGQRVRKVIESQNGVRQNERIYLGGFEIYREFAANGSTAMLKRESLHVMDDKQRIALVETQTVENGNGVNTPVPLQRYQLGNHLGSASVELHKDGALISYEEYHAYGTTAFQAGRSAAEVSLKRYRYTSQERDEESGFYYHVRRHYAPWLGRWSSCDPAGLVDGLNLLAYSHSNPVSFSDATGTQAHDVSRSHEFSSERILGSVGRAGGYEDMTSRQAPPLAQSPVAGFTGGAVDPGDPYEEILAENERHQAELDAITRQAQAEWETKYWQLYEKEEATPTRPHFALGTTDDPIDRIVMSQMEKRPMTQSEWEAHRRFHTALLAAQVIPALRGLRSRTPPARSMAAEIRELKRNPPPVRNVAPGRYTTNELKVMGEETAFANYGLSPGSRAQRTIPGTFGGAMTNRLDAVPTASNAAIGLPRAYVQVKNIAQWSTRDVNQLMNTWLEARLAPVPTKPVLLLRMGTPLPTPGIAGGLGRNVLNLIERGEIVVHRF